MNLNSLRPEEASDGAIFEKHASLNISVTGNGVGALWEAVGF